MPQKKLPRYERIYDQLVPLFIKVSDPISRMASIVAVLHNKFSYYFWTGFYRRINGKLLVGPYQGSLACMDLEKDTGVCWHGFNSGKTVIVPDVHAFPGHIACDSRSNSEIVVPVCDANSAIVAVLDVDSTEFDSFDKEDQAGLEKIVSLIFGKL